MKKAKLILTFLIVSILVLTQFAMVSAAPSSDEAGSISGKIFSITPIENAGETIYEIVLIDDQGKYQKALVSETKAYELGILVYDADENLVILGPDDWPDSLTITPDDMLPVEEEMKHPVGSALAAYFAELEGVDYEAIMTAHEDGFGFGVIAQALWLTQKIPGGNGEVLTEILKAKESGDYSYFSFKDGTIPTNWGQFRKAVMDGEKKGNLGIVMSSKEKDNGNNGGGSDTSPVKDNNKDKSKDNPGNGGNNGNPNNKVKKDKP